MDFCRAKVILIGLFSVLSISLSAYDDSPKCFQHLQRIFFQQSTVAEALSLHNVPQSQWFVIGSELESRNRYIPRRMKQQAKRMRRSPLENPFQPEDALELFRQVLWEEFVEVMKKYDGANQRNWRDIFSLIYQSESERINFCIGIE